MRFDTPVYFQKLIKGELDPETGDYLNDDIEEIKRFASVTDSGTKTLQLVYGNLKEGSKVVRLQRRYEEPFDTIRIGGKVYTVDFSRSPSRHAFVVSEVQGVRNGNQV